jgi:hypothetical protein
VVVIVVVASNYAYAMADVISQAFAYDVVSSFCMPLLGLTMMLILCQVEDYHPKVVEFRELLGDQLLHRLICDREGHLEDLLMMTVLDPRFKNMDFKGSSGEAFTRT